MLELLLLPWIQGIESRLEVVPPDLRRWCLLRSLPGLGRGTLLCLHLLLEHTRQVRAIFLGTCLGDRNAARESLHVVILEELQLLFPEDSEEVVALVGFQRLGPLEKTQKTLELLCLDAREERHIPDAIFVEEEREGIGAGIAAVDLLAGQRETVFLNRDVETLDLLPEALERLP